MVWIILWNFAGPWPWRVWSATYYDSTADAFTLLPAADNKLKTYAAAQIGSVGANAQSIRRIGKLPNCLTIYMYIERKIDHIFKVITFHLIHSYASSVYLLLVASFTKVICTIGFVVGNPKRPQRELEVSGGSWEMASKCYTAKVVSSRFLWIPDINGQTMLQLSQGETLSYYPPRWLFAMTNLLTEHPY